MGREYACSENIDIQLNKVASLNLRLSGEAGQITLRLLQPDLYVPRFRHGFKWKAKIMNEHTWSTPING